MKQFKKILCIILVIACYVGLVIQQICWIAQGLYNIIGLVWFLMITIIPYLLYKYWDK